MIRARANFYPNLPLQLLQAEADRAGWLGSVSDSAMNGSMLKLNLLAIYLGGTVFASRISSQRCSC